MIEEFRHDVLTTFAGCPVHEFGFSKLEDVEAGDLPADVESWAWRIALDDVDSSDFGEVLDVLVQTVETTRIKALILGFWLVDFDNEMSSDSAVNPLLELADRFPALEALFVGDMTSDHTEVSWIHQDDPAPVFAAFPRLRIFGLRGTTELSIAPISHENLEELTFQGGGLSPEIVRALCASQLPSLNTLELYLGTPNYNGGATPEDLAPILQAQAFPKLRHLGLRDAENSDEIAAAIAHAPVVAHLETLDLSLGNLSDEGAAALISGQPLTHLKSLDLHHHYLSDEMMQRIWAALPGVEVNMDEQEELDVQSWERWGKERGAELSEFRYIAVSE